MLSMLKNRYYNLISESYIIAIHMTSLSGKSREALVVFKKAQVSNEI